MDMLNQLTDSASAVNLPQDLLSQMQNILFTGLHHIMLISFGLLIVALLFNFYIQFRERKTIQMAAKDMGQEALR
jgi:hypothetical protein